LRREVRASQLDPSQVIYTALGPFPINDSDKAFAWTTERTRLRPTATATTFTMTPIPLADSLAELQREPSVPALSGGWKTRNGVLDVAPSEQRAIGNRPSISR